MYMTCKPYVYTYMSCKSGIHILNNNIHVAYTRYTLTLPYTITITTTRNNNNHHVHKIKIRKER